MFDNGNNVDMDPRMQAMLEQMMAGPTSSQVWLSMIPHVVQVVKAGDPETVAKDIDQIATKLTDRYMEMAAKEHVEAEQNAIEAAPSPIKFVGTDE